MTASNESIRARFCLREPFTQSLAWAAALQRVGWAFVFCGRAIAMLGPGEGGVFGKFQRARVLELPMIADLRVQAGAARLLAEPAPLLEVGFDDGTRRTLAFDPEAPEAFTKPFTEAGWRLSERPLSHSKTLVVDLAPGCDGVLASFSSGARRNVRLALERSPIRYQVVPFAEVDAALTREVRALHDAFLESHVELPDEWNIRSALLDVFGPDGRLVLARDRGELMGVVFLLVHDRVGVYYAAFSADRPQVHDFRIPSGLVFSAMRAALEVGCDLFDFMGVHDARWPECFENWKGFTTFKERFRGAPVLFPPSLEAPG